MAMNARASENYLAISRSSSASKSVEIFWAEIYCGRLIFRPNLVSFNRAVVTLLELSLADIRDGNEYIIWKWLVLKFHGSGHLPNHTTSK
jgi:hypothetical protein